MGGCSGTSLAYLDLSTLRFEYIAFACLEKFGHMLQSPYNHHLHGRLVVKQHSG